MIASNRTSAHKAHIIAQFEGILPGFSNYRLKFGRGQGYAFQVFVDMRFYFSHDGKVFHLISHRSGCPPHSIEIDAFNPRRA